MNWALDTVEQHLHEQAPHLAGPVCSVREPGTADGPRKISDVMTTSVVTVDRITRTRKSTASTSSTPGGTAVDKLTAAGVKAHGDVRITLFCYAARNIVDDAIEHDANGIVIGSRGRSDLAGFILGSTAHKVIHLTDRPVLIVR